MLKRRQLIEIADQPWCPAAIRNGLTDYLQFVLTFGKAYHPSAPYIANALKAQKPSSATQIVDLCSGGGGPWLTLHDALTAEGVSVPVLLTDMSPNIDAFQRIAVQTQGMVRGMSAPVDALSPPQDLSGFRTMFSAFHHFEPQEARKVLANAIRANEGIAIVEATHRSVPAILVTLLAPVLALFMTPFIRPFRFSRLFWTYIIPAIPLLLLFDGIVSCLRTYTPPELEKLGSEAMKDASAESVVVEDSFSLRAPPTRCYSWTAGEIRSKPGALPVTYLIGVPNANSSVN